MTSDSLPRDVSRRVQEQSALELEAKVLVGSGSPGEPVLGMLQREMLAVLDELEALRALYEDLDRDLLRSECRVRTDLHQLRPLRYGPDDKEPLRFSLKRRLEELARERRGVAIELNTQRREQLDRLSKLVERHRQLRADGD